MVQGEATSKVDPALKRRKVINIGGREWTIRDDGVPVHFADFITESRQINGIVYLAFASAVVDGSNPPEIHICSRVRLSLSAAQGLRDALTEMIKGPLKRSDQPKTN
jgi:hypothetical protein